MFREASDTFPVKLTRVEVELKYVCKAIMNTNTFGVQRSMKGSTTAKELAVSKVTQVGCEIFLNRKCPTPFI